MKDGNLIFSDQAVELIDHIIEMVDDIISAVTGMAGVKADSQLVIVYNAVINLCKLFNVRPISEPFPAMVSSAI